MKTYNIQIETNTAMNANFASIPLQLKNMYGYSIQVVMTGTPTGTFTLQASADPLTDTLISPPTAPSNWSTVTGSNQAVSAAGNFIYNISDVMYNWVRLVYVDGSSGVSTAIVTSSTFNGKGI